MSLQEHVVTAKLSNDVFVAVLQDTFSVSHQVPPATADETWIPVENFLPQLKNSARFSTSTFLSPSWWWWCWKTCVPWRPVLTMVENVVFQNVTLPPIRSNRMQQRLTQTFLCLQLKLLRNQIRCSWGVVTWHCSSRSVCWNGARLAHFLVLKMTGPKRSSSAYSGIKRKRDPEENCMTVRNFRKKWDKMTWWWQEISILVDCHCHKWRWSCNVVQG